MTSWRCSRLQRITAFVRSQRRCARLFRLLILMACVASVILVLSRHKEETECDWTAAGNWDERKEEELRTKYAVAIISSVFTEGRLNDLLNSWLPEGRQHMAQVFTDSSNASFLVRPGLKLTATGCPTTYTLGLWCKNMMMLRAWKTDPRYKDVQWFYRSMDDTFVHLENLMWLTKQYDSNTPVVLGERVCYWSGIMYPDGGPGFVVSRKFVEMWSEETFNATLEMHEGETIDDVMWGQLLQNMNVQLTHYSGFQHAHLTNEKKDNPYHYFMRHKQGPWPLKFRPIGIHQGVRGGLAFLPKLTYDLHQINYDDLDPNAVDSPQCDCGPRGEIMHGRCSYAPHYPSTGNGNMLDYGPGPWL